MKRVTNGLTAIFMVFGITLAAGTVNGVDLEVPDRTVTDCDGVCIPVTVTSFTAVAGVELHFDYDATCMVFDSISLGYLGGATINGGGGAAHIIWEDFANPITLADGDSLVYLCFSSITAVPAAACSIAFQASCELVDEIGDPLPLTTTDGSLACDDSGGGLGLVLPDVVGSDCDAVCIPVTVTSFTGVAGVELHLTYDTTCMVFDSISLGFLTGATVNGGGGEAHIIWEDFASPLTLTDGESLTYICFSSVTATPGSPCSIGFQATCELVDELGDPLEFTTTDGSVACEPSSDEIHLSLRDVGGPDCDGVCMPVFVSSFSGVAGVELHFTYDETCMTFDSISLGYLTGATVNGGGGEAHIIWEDFANPLTLPDGEILTYICFSDITAPPEAPCPMAFMNNCELVDELGDPLPFTTTDGSVACTGGSCCEFRGDVNNDGAELIDISDLFYMIDYMFTGGPAPVCFDAADIDASGSPPLDISDLFYLVNFMFTGGPPPLPCP
jgi:hypothetical protein